MIDPRSLGHSAAEEEQDAARVARLTPAERLRIFFELCELTDSIVRGRPDAERLRAPTPRSAEAEALWARLMGEGRRERARR